MCSQDQESRHHGQQARGEEGGVVGRPERGLGDGDPGEQKIFRVIRKYLAPYVCTWCCLARRPACARRGRCWRGTRTCPGQPPSRRGYETVGNMKLTLQMFHFCLL